MLGTINPEILFLQQEDMIKAGMLDMKLSLDIVRQTVLIRIQIGLKLLELEHGVLQRLAYNLPLFGQRQHIDIKLRYHNLYTQCACIPMPSMRIPSF